MGTGYGLVARWYAELGVGAVFGVMTYAFLFLVPIVIGYLTVRPHPAPSWSYRLLAPWLPLGVSVLVAWAIGWEGAICIVMGLPLMLILASLGGAIGGQRAARSSKVTAALVLLPLVLGPVEGRITPPIDARRVETSILIPASPERVWTEVVRVPTIAPGELKPALFTTMGFPRPISATLSHEGVGGIREARFDGGVTFLETITDWETARRIRFTIAPETDSIPATTLDRHVVVGGPYFTVLTGEYQLEPSGGGTLLHLTSELRVSTPFNFYAGPWADAIMRSIQRNILRVIQARSMPA